MPGVARPRDLEDRIGPGKVLGRGVQEWNQHRRRHHVKDGAVEIVAPPLVLAQVRPASQDGRKRDPPCPPATSRAIGFSALLPFRNAFCCTATITSVDAGLDREEEEEKPVLAGGAGSRVAKGRVVSSGQAGHPPTEADRA